MTSEENLSRVGLRVGEPRARISQDVQYLIAEEKGTVDDQQEIIDATTS